MTDVVMAIGAIGFRSVGVTVGSIAAAWKSSVYGGLVPAGSVFSNLQSAGATDIVQVHRATQVPYIVASVSGFVASTIAA